MSGLPRAALSTVALTVLGGLLAMSSAGAQGAAGAVVGLKYLWSFSSYGKPELTRPQSISVEPRRGELWVADTGKSSIVVLSRKGAPLARFEHWVRSQGPDPAPGEPCGVLCTGRGGAYITDSLSDRVDVVDFKGNVLRSLDVTKLLGLADRASPGGMDRDAAGNLYVVEQTSGQVAVIGPKGQLLRAFGSVGIADGQFEMIADVAVAADGTVWVLDGVGDPVVQSFDATGKLLSGFGVHADNAEGFHMPAALALDSAGGVWVADAFSHEVKAFTIAGEFLGVFGGMGTREGRFYFPADVAVGPSDVLYVLEKAGQRLQAFQIERQASASTPPGGSGGGEG